MILSAEYSTTLYRRESLIIFDEIQRCPKARQAIKYLVADGRYDYIETGSLISIKENTKDITLPSE
jgi:predicted AAA+ superfamily ATPase